MLASMAFLVTVSPGETHPHHFESSVRSSFFSLPKTEGREGKEKRQTNLIGAETSVFPETIATPRHWRYPPLQGLDSEPRRSTEGQDAKRI